MIGLNCGSGQRKFDASKGWINIDIQPKWTPDIIADWNDLGMFRDESVDIVISHHSLEHVGCGEGDNFVRESYRVLRRGGSLIVCVPNIRTLAQRWLLGQIDDFTYIVNLMGAYMGNEADRHKWHFTEASLAETLKKNVCWTRVGRFDNRQIDGADIAISWEILIMEAVK